MIVDDGRIARLILSNGDIHYISLCDKETVNAAGPWHNDGQGYAQRHIYINGKRTTQKLHKFIANLMGFTSELKIDHKNRIPFDCTRNNLRTATRQQNRCNSIMSLNNKSGYKGVYLRENSKKWRACIKINGKSKSIGPFNTAEEAARAYDLAVIRYYREFACLNFPIEDYAGQIDEINQLIKADDYRSSLKKIDRNGNLV